MSNGDESSDDELRRMVRHAQQMQLAYGMIVAMHGDLSLGSITEGVVKNLVEIGGLQGAEIVLDASVDNVRVHSAARAGNETAHVYRIPVVARRVEVGTLAVYYEVEENEAETAGLLDYVMPTISISIDNALSFLEVMDYRRTLEDRVVERTAQLAEAHAQLAHSLEDLREAKAARDRFFANINHEIRTPLTLILLAADGIERSDESHRNIPQRLEEIKGGTRRLLHLVDSMLLLAAGDEGKLRIRPTPIDVAGVTGRVVRGWRSAAENGRIELVYDGPASCPASMDEAAVETIVGNFISNAVKFTPPGGRIIVALAATEDSVTIRVRDTGPGVDPEFIPKLFGRFERSATAVARGVRGTGIGLSLSKELVDLQRGSLEVIRHDDPCGTSFVMCVPRHQAVIGILPDNAASHAVNTAEVIPRAEPTAAAPRATPSPGSKPRSPGEATIVLAEDDPTLSKHIAAILSERYTVLVAPNGRLALELAREHLPDILITDLEMPEMDGIELTREFLKLEGTALSPVLIVSAHTGLGDRLQGFEAGAVDYVVKPFSGDELLARVRNQLAIRRLALRLHESQKLAAMGMLSAGLAHELRNPANALVNALGPLLELLPAEHRKPGSAGALLAGVALDAGNQIRERSRSILDYSRAARVHKQPQDLGAMLARSRQVLASALEGVEVREDLRLDGPVSCAAPLIEQVLMNLLDNAAFAAGRGGWIEISARHEPGLAVIELSDSGPGIPANLVERIFDPFFTTKRVGEGSGLGLTISRRIALNHGGDLRVLRRARGMVFRLELPD